MNIFLSFTSLLVFPLLSGFSCQPSTLPTVPPADSVHLNQVSFSVSGSKVAVVEEAEAGPFWVLNQAGDTLLTGTTGPGQLWDASGKWASRADFSALNQAGDYVLVLSGGSRVPFRVAEQPGREVVKQLVRSLYFQRCSQPLDAGLAGAWARGAGHPDQAVKVHPSAASDPRPAGATFAFPGGWYDAGDYGKYTGPTAFVAWSLLHLTELDESWETLDLDIPESGNELPDLVDEALVGIRYLLAIQDPSGFVPHKLTALHHAELVMPEGDQDERFLIGKATSSTLSFVACMAQAGRVLVRHEAQLPGLVDECLAAAERAWIWCLAHPDLTFANPADVKTGEYKDSFLEDEWAWAAMERWLSTGKREETSPAQRLLAVAQSRYPFHGDASWTAMLSMSLHVNRLSEQERLAWREQAAWRAGRMKEHSRVNPYHSPMGLNENDFNWGSNSIVAKMGLWFLMTGRLDTRRNFNREAGEVGAYLLGQNPLDLCMITGMGERSPMDIHHRPSKVDDVPEPVPGFLVGGPQNVVKLQDCEAYPSSLPALKYLDAWCSYSTNEVAINWNANAFLFFGWLDQVEKSN